MKTTMKRAVHIDFHTMPKIDDFGANYEPVDLAEMLADAHAMAEENTKNAQALIDAENQRVDEARRVAADKIDQLAAELGACIQALNRIKAANPPAPIGSSFYDYDREPDVVPRYIAYQEIDISLVCAM